jgi:methylmalonyl-CoA mutase
MSEPTKLGAEFPLATDDAWNVLVEQTLKGRNFDKALVHKSADGIAVGPLYTKENSREGHALNLSHKGGWDIRQSYQSYGGRNAKAVNKQILDDLKGGTNSILLVGGLDGLFADLETLLSGVHLDMITIGFDIQGSGLEQSQALQAVNEYFAGKKGTSIDYGLDPLGGIAQFGGAEEDLVLGLSSMIIQASENINNDNNTGGDNTAINVNTAPYHGGGCSEAQELAFALATGVHYLRHLEGAQIPLDEASEQMMFTLCADADFNLTLSKFRAFRLLWGRVLEASGVTGTLTKLYGQTASRMFTKRDPWVNILRGTVACFAAGVGGADGMTVHGYNSALNVLGAEGGEQSRRIARNIQIILQEECGLAQVLDPAAGSWAIETLTGELVEKAWAIFQTIEQNGGMAASLADGTVESMVSTSYATSEAQIHTRKTPLTGISEYPNIHEKPVATTPVKILEPNRDAPMKPIPQHRLAEGFEALRDRAEGFHERPKVFLANLGQVSQHVAHATWAKNFVEAGGFEAIPTDGYDDADSLAGAFKMSGAGIAIICGTDDQYNEMASDVATALKAQGAKAVYSAGKGSPNTKSCDDIDGHIHIGVNVLETLTNMFEQLGEAS